MATTANPVTTPQDVPADLADLVQAGTDALGDGDLRRALDHFEAVIAAFPDRPEGHNNLGALYSGIGEFAKAEACFGKVLDLLPGNPNVHYNRGVARSHQGNFAAAREDFAIVLEATPNDPDTLNNLGVAAYMEGRLPEAREYFSRALLIRPDYVNALLNRVDVECVDGNAAGAARLCENFLAATNSREVRRRHLDLLVGIGRDALARAAVTADAILAVGDDADVKAELGRITRAGSAWQQAAEATI